MMETASVEEKELHHIAQATLPLSEGEDVEILLKKRADPNSASAQHGNTALHWAGWYNREEISVSLLVSRADPSTAAMDGVTPAHNAARMNSLSVLMLLCAAGCDLGAVDDCGLSLLFYST